MFTGAWIAAGITP